VKKHIGELRKIVTDKLNYLISRLGWGSWGCEGLSQWNRHSDSCRFNLGRHLVRAETYRFL